jgi:carboxyl-terminal processing protease
MPLRVSRRAWNVLLLLAACVAPAGAQTFSAPAIGEQVAIATEAPQAAISSLIEKGRSLESSGRWAEALAHYEEALREHPEDVALTARFDLARLHYSLEQRYDDRSFRESVTSLHSREALDLYNDVLSKIGAHYFTAPPWRQLVGRGASALQIALADRDFLSANHVRASQQQINNFSRELGQLTGRYAINSQRDAVNVASQAAQLARRQIGLSEAALLLEFTSAAAGGLDHYSAYLTGDQLRDIYSQIEGNFVGLGVELKADDGALLIVRVIPGSPAEKSGIRADDRIVAVGNQATNSMSTDEAAGLLTGPVGSTCQVTVVTSGTPARQLAVRRDHVEVPSLEDVKIIDPENGVAYIRIPAFQKTTSRDLEAALWSLVDQKMQSLVLDLRGNPGGLLTASVEVADKFIADGPIVSTRGRSEQENFNYRAHRPGTWRVPLVVLIDGDSASASEIFAAAIKDSGRGKVVGTRSYGKGSVQGIFPLGYAGAGARITTAKFFSPMGHPISNVGVSPDIDARRATVVADGGPASQPAGTHQVAYRGPMASSTNAVGAAATVESAAESRSNYAPSDSALELAVEVARHEPVAQL